MNKLYAFILRAIIGLVFAVLLTKMFRPDWDASYTVGLAGFLVGMAYLMEHFRKKRS